MEEGCRSLRDNQQPEECLQISSLMQLERAYRALVTRKKTDNIAVLSANVLEAIDAVYKADIDCSIAQTRVRSLLFAAAKELKSIEPQLQAHETLLQRVAEI